MNSFAQTQSAAAPAELAEIVAPTGTWAKRRGAPVSRGAAARPVQAVPDVTASRARWPRPASPAGW